MLGISNPNDGSSPAEAKQQPAGADKSGTGSRSKSIVEWPPYDQIHRRYLCIGNFCCIYSA